MTRRHAASFACGLVALLGAFVAVGLPVLAGSAQSIDDAGWWWRAKQGPVGSIPVSAPSVQPGQLLVQGAADGATAIAALRATLAEGQAHPTVTLAVAPDGDQGGESAILLACQTGSSWSGGDAQSWDSKPKPDCTVSVQGQRSDDGSTWVFPVGALQVYNELNVIFVSGTDPALPEGANGSMFSLTFEQPTAASITTTGGTAPAPPTGPVVVPTSPLDDPGTYAPPIGTGTFDLAPVQPALPPEEQGLTATAPVVQAATPAPVFEPIASVRSGGARALGALIVLLGAAGSWWFAQQPVPEPRKLGRFAGTAPAITQTPSTAPEIGGLGRFARPRHGAPRRLS